jgi:hypothetical protein
MATILFSFPIHENHESVLTNIANLRRFNGLQHHVMIHASANWQDFDESWLHLYNVHINHLRWPMVHNRSQIPIHLSNYRAARDRGLDFDYVAVLHSSEMFVRRGLAEHMAGTDFSTWFTPDTQPHDLTWPPLAHARAMRLFGDLFDAAELSNYICNLIEGHWWRRELFEEMDRWSAAHFAVHEQLWEWAAEEIYFPTLAWHLAGSGAAHTTPYCAFKHDQHFLSDRQFVEDIRAGVPVTFWQPHNYRYDYAPFPSSGLFSVKRVDRRLDDPMRCYIGNLHA